MNKICVEYIWLDSKLNLRSKTRVVDYVNGLDTLVVSEKYTKLESWNYDGSSTGQATGVHSEIVIVPRATFKDPFRGGDNLLALCDTYDKDDNPLPTNNYAQAKGIFENKKNEKPMFGLEQEYFLFDSDKPLREQVNVAQDNFYCGVGAGNAFWRHIAEEHLEACIAANISITGINAEVAPGQWEFQIFDTGVKAAHHLWMARYLLIHIAEKYKIKVNFEPKPFEHLNGTGCHCNVSTLNMRDGNGNKPGISYINEALDLLETKHMEHMAVYGEGNRKRMTGENETADYDVFTRGVGNRGASIRIGKNTAKNGKGYFEDRRPGGNADPYLVTGMIFKTIMEL
jgi:glutamine synthetase